MQLLGRGRILEKITPSNPLDATAEGSKMTYLLFFLLGALVVAVVWWLANKATKVVDQPDFDNEIHWHKYRDVQSKRGDL